MPTTRKIGRPDTAPTACPQTMRHRPPSNRRSPGIILIAALIITALAWPAPLTADGGPVTATPGPVQVKVVEEWPGGLVVDLELHGMAAEPSLHHDGFHRLSIPGAGRLAEEGRPELPAVGRYVAIPRGARVTVEILGDEIRIPALRPAPHQPPHIDDRSGRSELSTADPDPAVYENSATFPARRAAVETPRDVRGCRMALLKFFPVRYDPADRSLLYTPRMRVRLLFEGGDGRFIDPRHSTPVFETFFRALLLNPDSLGRPPGDFGGPPPACEMLIITPAIFETEALRLAEWKNQRGIPTQVRTTAEIGTTVETTVEEIDAWIEDRYHNEWPELSYLLFFGDVGEVDSVPCHYRTFHEVDEILVGTDHYYGVIGDGVDDYFPDLFLGRISVNTVEEAELVVDKIVNYEQAPDTSGDWLESVLLAAYNQPNRYFISTSEAIHDHLAPLGFSCNRQYEAGTPPGSTIGVLDAINEGVFLVTHRDHGQDRNAGDQHTGWNHPEFTEEHMDELDNEVHLPVMFSVNCRSGWFDGETDGHAGSSRESFCELLLRESRGGVVGVIGDTRTSWSGYNDELLKGFIDAIWDQFDPFYPDGSEEYHLPSPLYQMGAVLNFGKFWMLDKYILAGGEPYGWPPTELRNRIQFEVYHYHGDPSMEIWTGTPTNDWQVLYNPPFFGDTSFTVTDVYPDDALVAVSRDGVLLGRAVSSGNQAVVQFAEPLDQLGDLTLCITRHDQLPYLDTTVEVEIPDGPWVLYHGHQLDDVTSGGNGDGWVSPGETVNLSLEMHNFGTTTAQNVVVTLDCPSGLAELLQGQSAYPAIDPSQTAVNSQPLSFQVLPACPDGELVTFMASATDGVSSWESEFIIEINGAHITYYSHQILDNLPGGGNQDYIADPGERFDLRISLRNIGLVYASQVTAELATEEPGVTITPPELVFFPNISAGNVGTSFSPHFRVAIDETIPCGTVVPFTLLVNAAEGQSSTEFNLLVGGREVVFFDDMEQGTGDWTSSELEAGEVDWERVLDQPPGNSGYAWFSPGEETEDHGGKLPPAKDNRLISPTFPVTRSATLSFRHRVVMHAGFDGCVLEISTDGEEPWTDLGTRITYGGYTHRISEDYNSPIAGRMAWSGTSGPSLTRVEVDLDDFAGNDATLRYRLVCDTTAILPDSGWTIDDLEVEGVLCNSWMSPDETISMEMICTPVSATLPFTVNVQAIFHNDCTHARRVAATLDLQLAGGYYLANLVTNSQILYPDQPISWGISRIFPGHPLLVGVNTFRFSVYDITEYPYNQPPQYPASGDTAVETCEVECLIP